MIEYRPRKNIHRQGLSKKHSDTLPFLQKTPRMGNWPVARTPEAIEEHL